MKVAVIGVGGSGSAALRFLAQTGHEVVGYEQFAIGHDRGSSHGHSRIIRRTYPDSFHTRMMARAYELWDDLEKEAQEELFVRCGGITFGPEDDEKIIATRASLEEAKLDYELLTREEVSQRHPAIDIGIGNVAVFQKDSGFLRASNCVQAQARLATQNGALIHEHTAVRSIEEDSRKVTISTDANTQRFDAVVVTAGPWLGKFLAPLKLPLRTALRQVIYAAIGSNEGHFAPGRMPVWIEEPSEYYGFPSDGAIPGMKFASHDAGRDFDPDHPERPVMDEWTSRAMEHAVKRFPDLTGEIISMHPCLYTITPDERFIVDHAPGSQRVVLCSACSGHGFKFTILSGWLAGTLVTVKQHAPPPEWSISRFL